MAAPILTSMQMKNSLKAAKSSKKSARNVLLSPYNLSWPDIPLKDTVDINKRLKGLFSELNLKRESKREKLLGKRSKAKNDAPGVSMDESKETDTKRIETNPSKTTPSKEQRLRAQLKIGINEVTRSLENDDLGLVLVDAAVKPPMLIKHLLTLATVRKCPIAKISGLANNIASLLGVTSLVTFGFMKPSENDDCDMDDVVDFVRSKCISQDAPWLNNPTQLSTAEETDVNEDGHDKKTCVDRSKETPVDLSKIYVKKSDSKLVDGKVNNVGFGTMAFVGFGEMSSDDEELDDTSQKRRKRKKPVVERTYKKTAIGKMQGNPDRPHPKRKK